MGSTDLIVALNAAMNSFEAGSNRVQRIVYLGDGFSQADVVSSKEFGQLVDGLVQRRISVSSFVIGPRRDVYLLATLANHTGGNLLADADGVSAEQSGQTLARIATAPVYWPRTAELPETFSETYPQRVPPLRTDRDTILVGVLASGPHRRSR